ncbi:hypothetical protein N7478_010314 [Penicillium angulare]|uniref:uncharacterized protein n=1 Tax=Penicillium angulare TaxID=116970 RepID=UPI002541A546|nr:uncharacterized protein N7478_010314 [Penicillium angulare]KAJ5267506.1 hypothetical protein N7478_010314 [Penicillium angulare]
MAISSLRKELSNSEPRLSVEMVTTAMALCTNDVCNGNMEIWRTHLRGVLRLLVAFLEGHEISSSATEPFIEFLVKWFKTMDIIAALSGHNGQCTHISEDNTLSKVLSSSGANVDNICGYSLKLIPMMAEISSLARRGQSGSIENFILSNPSASEINLEAEIQVLIEKPMQESRQDGDRAFGFELQSTHRAFVHSALLHLHRRVNMLPKHDIRVRADISSILEAVTQIPPFSFANILILWPIFSAGCETDISAERDIIQERMKNMQTLGMGNFTRARELLLRFWSSGTSLPWDKYFSQLGLELVLF